MKQRPKIGSLVKGWTCPCGCELQLDQYQVNDEQRLIALLGPKPNHVSLRPAGVPAQSRRTEPKEPTTKGMCRSCGGAMEIFTFLAESLRLRSAPWPHCDACMKQNVQPIAGAA